ncbi:MAG: cbb3-type cytochrome oxidase assembly protein [Sandaracinaceae bacterium]
MNVLILTMFVSLILAVAGVGFFIWTVRQGAHEHGDRLALLPLESGETITKDPEEN